MSLTVPSLHRPHAESPARVTRRSDAPDPGFESLANEQFELVSRGDFVNGRLDGPVDPASGARPLVVLLHDAAADARDEALGVAADWAGKGVLVARLDLPLHGHRKSPKLSERLVNGCAALADGAPLDADTRALVEEFARQSVSDVLRTIEALGAEDDVDAGRITLIGLGLGAQVAAWAAPHAAGLAACVLAGGIGRLADAGLDPTSRFPGAASKATTFLAEIAASGGRAAVEDQEALLAALPESSRRIESASASAGAFSAGITEAIDALLDEVVG